MKKLLSLLGAIFMGSAAMAQAAKADTINKPGSRKVMPAELANKPVSTNPNASSMNHTIKMNASKNKIGEQKDGGLKQKDSASIKTGSIIKKKNR